MENFGGNESSTSDSKSEAKKDSKSTDKARDVGSIAGLAARERVTDTAKAEKTGALLDKLLKPETLSEPKVEAAAESATEETETDTDDNDKLADFEPGETVYIAEKIVDAHQQELADKPTPSSSAEAAADASQGEFLDTVQDKLQAEPVAPEQVIAAAAEEIAERVEAIVNNEVEPPADGTNRFETPPSAEFTPPLPLETPESVPPTPPSPPNPPAFSPMPGPGGYNPNTYAYAPPQPLETSSTIDPNTVSKADLAYYERQAENRGLLLGGIVGYLLGRRRGRIKTEKRLGKVQKQLEQRVKTMDTDLTAKEQQVRTLTSEKFRQASALQQQELQRMRTAERPQTVEAAVQQQARPIEQQPARPTSEQVKRMNARELVAAAEKVVIEGANLRQIYESHAITEPGLRHVLSEFLRGGDASKALTQELAIKEMTFERDPQARDRIAASMSASVTGTSTQLANHQQLPPTASTYATTVREQAAAKAAPKSKSRDPLQQTLVRAWIAVVVVLAIVVVILFVR